MNERPIAVFDSGLGGLSVVRHLRRLLPGESIVYFGDTARVPYGTKSRRTVARFALEAARYLLRFDPKLAAAACNTASALALDEIRAGLPVPVVGVLEPGARAAVEAARGRTIAIIGTEATVGSGAYQDAVRRIEPQARVVAKACPLFVPLVEEGRACDDPLVRLAVEQYLARLCEEDVGVLVLACTHYPLLRPAIRAFLGPQVQIIDCGHAASLAVRQALEQAGALSGAAGAGSIRCYVSDNPQRFRRIGSRFLDETIDHVELVPPESYVAAAMLEAQGG